MTSPRSDSVRVAVGIPTYRRPETLAALLDVLPERLRELDPLIQTKVFVVDNDPAGSAREVVAATPLEIGYVIEPTPGIAAVRNRLMDEAASFRAIAFIDDDERPLAGWLPALVETWTETGASAVMGRVISVFEHDVDPWLIATGVFRRRERPTGQLLSAAAAGTSWSTSIRCGSSACASIRRWGSRAVRTRCSASR